MQTFIDEFKNEKIKKTINKRKRNERNEKWEK